MTMDNTIDPRIIDGTIWQAFSEKVAELGQIVWNDEIPDDPLVKAEGAQYLLRFLAAGLRVCVELDDSTHPFIDFNIYNRMSWGLDNPDCNYSYARLDGTQRYRISGHIGCADNIEFQVTSGHHADGNFGAWQSISALRGRDMEVSDDGSFTLTLSAKPTDGNWMKMTGEASFLLIREFFSDWQQRPAQFTMESLDAHYPPAPLTSATIAGRFDLLMQWLEVGARCWQQFAAGILANQPGDISPFLPPADAAALGGQAYGMGAFELAEDEAIILRFTPPDCLVWGISLCDRFLQSIDFDHRQSSLNSSQAMLNNGECIGVIAHRDPGIHNWFDCGGHTLGIIAVRYVLTDEVPAVSYQKIKLTELDDHLPQQIQRIDAQQRSEQLRARRLAYQRRTKP